MRDLVTLGEHKAYDAGVIRGRRLALKERSAEVKAMNKKIRSLQELVDELQRIQ